MTRGHAQIDNRKLSLSRESLRKLTVPELKGVAAAAGKSDHVLGCVLTPYCTLAPHETCNLI